MNRQKCNFHQCFYTFCFIGTSDNLLCKTTAVVCPVNDVFLIYQLLVIHISFLSYTYKMSHESSYHTTYIFIFYFTSTSNCFVYNMYIAWNIIIFIYSIIKIAIRQICVNILLFLFLECVNYFENDNSTKTPINQRLENK